MRGGELFVLIPAFFCFFRIVINIFLGILVFISERDLKRYLRLLMIMLHPTFLNGLFSILGYWPLGGPPFFSSDFDEPEEWALVLQN